MSNLDERLNRWKKRYHNARKKPDVWILDDDKVAFIQIRKVASRSAKNALCQFLLRDGEHYPKVTPEEIETLDRQYAHHVSTRRVAQLARSYYVFTIVRNPLARLYSCYADKIVRYRDLGRANDLEHYGLNFDMDFSAFVRRVAEIPDLESNTHFRSMHPFLTYRGELIPHTICRMEDLATDWLEVQAHIPGFPDLPRLNQTNSSDRPAYATAYDRETAEIACKRFRTDIDLLGYADQVRVYVDSLPG